METLSHFVGDYEGDGKSFDVTHIGLSSDDREILDRVVDLKGGPSTTAQLNEFIKTADLGPAQDINRPQSSPAFGNRTGSLSPSGQAK
jgi:hypothetical protein